MSDDLIERLRHCISDLTTTQKRAKQAERALAEAVEHYEWGRENQRLTDADNDKEYEAMRSRAEQAERALAEAVEVLRPFAEIREALELISANKPGDVLQDERAIFQTWGLKDTPTSRQITLGHLRAARQFVKEHTP